MKKWSKLFAVAFFAATICCSCENLNEEPPVNAGYKSNIRIPDPENLTLEDVLMIQEQQDEYNKNK